MTEKEVIDFLLERINLIDTDYPQIPVFGSIGDKQKAMSVCKIMNRKENAR